MCCVPSYIEGTVAPSSKVRVPARLLQARWGLRLTALLLSFCVWASAPAHSQSPLKAGPVVSYNDGQLTIDPHGAALHDVLKAIKDRVGFTLDLPSSGMDARVLDERIGPAPVKEVLVQLLYGCGVNYIIQTASGTPQDVQRLFLSTPSRAPAARALWQRRDPKDDSQEPQVYAGFIPANTSARS